MKKIVCVVLLFFTTSCSNLEFIYNDNLNLINPLYERTNVVVSGVDLVFMNSYVPMFFGKNENSEFNLLINIKEKKNKKICRD